MNIWTDNMSYLLGVIHGDGHVAKRSISISVGYKDKEYASYLTRLIEMEGFNPKVYRQRTAMRLDVHNKVFTDLIRNYKSNGIWKLPNDINQAEWLAGIFDSDGCVTSPPKRAIIITLKRSGNLKFVKNALESYGVKGVNIHERVSKYINNLYPIEELRLTSFDNILIFGDNIPIRHPNKVDKLNKHLLYIREKRLKLPLWMDIALWLKEGERNWKEISIKYNLTKSQVDSILQNIKRHYKVKIIPPEEQLTKYLVKNQ